MKHSKLFFFLGLVLIVLPFTGLPLAWKHGIGVAIGIIIIIVAIFEQVAAVVEDRESSFKRIQVKQGKEDEQV